MTKFYVKFQRVFEVEIEAETNDQAEVLARNLMVQFPPDTAKLLSVIVEGHADKPCLGCQEDGPIRQGGTPPKGNPNGGGSPGTPTIRVPELVDQIAEVA